MTYEECLNKLITTGHLNVVERRCFGGNKIPVSQIVLAINTVLDDNRFFPPALSIWQPGEVVYEGLIIEKVKDDEYILHYQRAHPLMPNCLAASKTNKYSDIDTVVLQFIRECWNTDIDGIGIDWTK